MASPHIEDSMTLAPGRADLQPSLFHVAEEDVLVDDERGRITYRESFVDADTATRWFAELKEAVVWRSEQRRMFHRDIVVPRLLAHYRLDSPEIFHLLQTSHLRPPAQLRPSWHNTAGKTASAAPRHRVRDRPRKAPPGPSSVTSSRAIPISPRLDIDWPASAPS